MGDCLAESEAQFLAPVFLSINSLVIICGYASVLFSLNLFVVFSDWGQDKEATCFVCVHFVFIVQF